MKKFVQKLEHIMEWGRVGKDAILLGVSAVLLTGDNENAAKNIASKLRIKDVHAGCLPEDKMKYIDYYDSKGQRVCMICDGINEWCAGIEKGICGHCYGWCRQ